MAGGLLFAAAPALADTTAVQTVQVDLGDLDKPGNGTFQQFDPSLGTLASMTITADVTMTFEVCMTNRSPEASTIDAGVVGGKAPITFAGNIVADATGAMDVPATTLAATSGVDSCTTWRQTGVKPTAPDSFYITEDDQWPFSRAVSDPSILSMYTGTGTVPVSWEASSASTLGQPSEWTIIFQAHGAGRATIQYTYDVAPTSSAPTETRSQPVPTGATPVSTRAGAAAASSGDLANTGAPAAQLAGVAVALFLGGSAMVFAGVRRRSNRRVR
ncbi:choice-of-anchor E domain-containing protein [Amycolatopsis sp. SID8362]|uniref:choice-of-anchor E domain-containing protein n=1 Tax=Amycolatopsis sp. SID8362 TaxID=2690346 RepID=UPI001371CD5B|nr:choice-of-anchor E domain-containing protein [Amycolatopsis sp. SID8362]NBH04286.1 choice-of-anchor E domain-containing protein [Amycolatopsis sp. SID8362]NED40985.1 choice-of-anchor E domain-containing protein [Amycolatopsis sp. SID8362]